MYYNYYVKVDKQRRVDEDSDADVDYNWKNYDDDSIQLAFFLG